MAGEKAMARRTVLSVLVILVAAALFASITKGMIYEKTSYYTTVYSFDEVSGSFGFEVEIKDNTSFWIASMEDIDTEAGEASLSDEEKAVGQIVLSTKSQGNYIFTITRTLLYLTVNGERTGTSVDYHLYFGDDEISASADTPYTTTYRKQDNSSARISVGTFTAVTDETQAPASGTYVGSVTVSLTVE